MTGCDKTQIRDSVRCKRVGAFKWTCNTHSATRRFEKTKRVSRKHLLVLESRTVLTDSVVYFKLQEGWDEQKPVLCAETALRCAQTVPMKHLCSQLQLRTISCRNETRHSATLISTKQWLQCPVHQDRLFVLFISPIVCSLIKRIRFKGTMFELF